MNTAISPEASDTGESTVTGTPPRPETNPAEAGGRKPLPPKLEESPLWILLLLNPLLVLTFLTDPAPARWLLVALALLVALLGSPRLSNEFRRPGPELWPLAGLVAVILLHLGSGAPNAEAVRWLAHVVTGGAAYLYVRTLDQSRQRRGMALMVCAGALIGAYAILQAVGLDFLHYRAESWMYRVVTTFGHRNFTAVFLVVSLFVGLEVGRSLKGRAEWLTLLQVGFIYAGLFATGSRLPILLATLGLLGYFLTTTRPRRRVATAVVVLLAGWLALIAFRGELGLVVTRTETFRLRADLYRATQPLLLEQPVVGLGPGAFARRIPAQLAAASERPSHLVFLHAHMLPMEILIEMGTVGLVSCLLFLVPLYRGLLRKWTSCPVWLVGAHLSWLATNLYGVNFFTYAGWVTLWPVLAFMRSATEPTTTEGPPIEAAERRWIGQLVVILPLLITCFVLSLMATSSYLSKRALRLAGSGRPELAVTFYDAASEVWPLPLQERYRAAIAYLSAGRPESGVSQLLELEQQAPAFSAVRYNLATGMAEMGRYSEAVEWIAKHLEAYPADRRAIWLQAVLRKRHLAAEPPQPQSETVPRKGARGDPGDD